MLWQKDSKKGVIKYLLIYMLSRLVLVTIVRCGSSSFIAFVVRCGHGWWCVVVRGGGPGIVVVRRCPWSWPWSSVIMVFALCSSLVPRGCGPLSSMNICHRHLSEQGVVRGGLSCCNTKEAILRIHHPPLPAVRFHLVFDAIEFDAASARLYAHCLSWIGAVWSSGARHLLSFEWLMVGAHCCGGGRSPSLVGGGGGDGGLRRAWVQWSWLSNRMGMKTNGYWPYFETRVTLSVPIRRGFRCPYSTRPSHRRRHRMSLRL